MNAPEGVYASETRTTIAETPTLRVRLLALGDGQCVPWHYHNNITDTFFCMQGTVQVQTRNPDQIHVLAPGETLAVQPKTPHRVAGLGDRACKFMVVQGVGEYDFVAVED